MSGPVIYGADGNLIGVFLRRGAGGLGRKEGGGGTEPFFPATPSLPCKGCTRHGLHPARIAPGTDCTRHGLHPARLHGKRKGRLRRRVGQALDGKMTKKHPCLTAGVTKPLARLAKSYLSLPGLSFCRGAGRFAFSGITVSFPRPGRFLCCFGCVSSRSCCQTFCRSASRT